LLFYKDIFWNASKSGGFFTGSLSRFSKSPANHGQFVALSTGSLSRFGPVFHGQFVAQAFS
jgi:hypothetical protein